jgi:hypothetical protein
LATVGAIYALVFFVLRRMDGWLLWIILGPLALVGLIGGGILDAKREREMVDREIRFRALRGRDTGDMPLDVLAVVLDDRVRELHRSIEESAGQLGELHTELAQQAAALERLRGMTETQRRLAQLSENDASAVRQLVESAFEDVEAAKNARQSRYAWGFFSLGAVTSIPFGVLTNYVYDYLAD